MRSLPLKALQTFEAVARYNNFHGAANELCVTPSAVSHQIKNLELWLQCPLFTRRGNQLELLPHAKILAADLSISLAQIKTSCSIAKQNTQSKSLVIAAIPSVATCWLIPKLNNFQQLHPSISLRVSYAIHGINVDFSEVDIAFIFALSPPKIKDASVELFRPGRSYPVCSTDFLKNNGSITHIDITRGPLLHDSARNDSWGDWFTKNNLHVPHQNEGASFDDFNLLRSAALAGQGIALCPIAMIEDDIKENRLVQLSEQAVSEQSGYYLLRSLHSNPAVESSSELFRQWVFQQP